MKKLLFLLLCFFSPLISYALDYPEVNSQMVEVYDLTEGKILYELDSNNKASIASITKIATTITAIETIDNIDEKGTITSDILNQVSWEASTAGLEVGDVIKVGETNHIKVTSAFNSDYDGQGVGEKRTIDIVVNYVQNS